MKRKTLNKQNMRILLTGLLFSIFLLNFYSCSKKGKGELVGVLNRESWYEPQPYGMVFIPAGSYNMGPDDQDVAWAMTAETKTVTVAPFWMDETEITNNEYRQFVFWVRDSIAYKLLGAQLEQYLITQNEYGEDVNPPFINWEQKNKMERTRTTRNIK